MHKATSRVINKTSSILNTFLRDEAIGGRLILLAALLSVIVVNSPLVDIYASFWHTNLTIGFGSFAVSQDLLHWLNEGLMTIFFFVVGLEVRRELTVGELKKASAAALPVAAAIGGMLVPAMIYMAINTGEPGFKGWGIPMATDIAIAVGVLSLLSKHIPKSLKVFLLTLAIVDDIGAVLVIAMFYTSEIHLGALLLATLLVPLGLLIKRLKRIQMPIFFVFSVCLWFFAYKAGIVPSIVGIILAMLVPARRIEGAKASTAETLEKINLPLSTFVIVPLFAFANAGVILATSVFDTRVAALVGWGIFMGLFIGKVLGIGFATWLMIRFKFSALPKNITWQHIIGVGFLAGIGFTISIFITSLAFESSPELIHAAKISIFITSILSGIVGLVILRLTKRPPKKSFKQ